MNEACVACGAQIDDDATRCRSCGLAFGADDGAAATAAPPPHVGLYLGDVPSPVAAPADDAPTAPETPPPASRRRRLAPAERRWRLLVALLVVAVAGAAFRAWLSLRRPPDSYTATEKMFERFADSERLAPVAVPQIP